ncbi:hypothetical protein QYM36_007829 [Artemia franciscana]|uniref:Protein kinase domain-containing protein n=1 Tax=Artemia franciscana TaxID=6661 RepID=A0AA88LHH3_ARTSF|nr:hypothetical protein QYM36_007829 [Artemia franciscana]
MRLVLGTGIGVWNAGLRSWELGCEFRSGVLGGGVKAANAVMGDEPEDILLQSKCEEPLAKLADFGLSKYAPEDLTALKTFCGTMNYIAPEVLKRKGKKEYNPKVDVCLAGHPAFSDGYRDEPMCEQIIHGILDSSPKYWSSISEQGQNLVRSMLTVSAVSRLSMSEVLKHPWFSNDTSLFERYEDLISKLPSLKSIRSVPLLGNHLTASVSSRDSDVVFLRHVKRRKILRRIFSEENIENSPKIAKISSHEDDIFYLYMLRVKRRNKRINKKNIENNPKKA